MDIERLRVAIEADRRKWTDATARRLESRLSKLRRAWAEVRGQRRNAIKRLAERGLKRRTRLQQLLGDLEDARRAEDSARGARLQANIEAGETRPSVRVAPTVGGLQVRGNRSAYPALFPRVSGDRVAFQCQEATDGGGETA